jgi:tRNA G10  N-methylase Trm11
MKQNKLFEDKVTFEYVKSVIGSGYEEKVADLAIRDKVAYRAARKNMQIHSAIILKINDEFSGFFTFQVNHEAKEFCLLQSAMELDRKDKDIYKDMLREIIKQNTYGYPMIMTVSTKHDLECPKVLADVGFKTYLILSGYEYMVYGTFEQVRIKRLAHATMTNTWNSTKGDWLKMKHEWNDKIEADGLKHGVANPKFASREGCWQGKAGFSNVVLTKQTLENGKVKNDSTKSLNGNASVLDPVACEVILRFFMPTSGKRVYNPFGGGVQFGYVAGSYGYEYISSEIRQNQCDANNAICKDLNSAKWIKSDSTKYIPEGKFDLCFTCPPYYKVEEYLDYDGKSPEGELNATPTYEQFRDMLFEGYKNAISVLNDNCFFVVMTGDSRDKDGGYYGCEADHELFFKSQGLYIYNRIDYLECEFTRLAQAKKTLNYRKFPKRVQKILVFYKGDIKKIPELYPPIGRL